MNDKEKPNHDQNHDSAIRNYATKEMIPLKPDQVLLDLGHAESLIDTFYGGKVPSDWQIIVPIGDNVERYVEIPLSDLITKAQESLESSLQVLSALKPVLSTFESHANFIELVRNAVQMQRWEKALSYLNSYDHMWDKLEVFLPQFTQLLTQAFDKLFHSMSSEAQSLTQVDRDAFNTVLQANEIQLMKNQPTTYDQNELKFVNTWRQLSAKFVSLNEQVNDPRIKSERIKLRQMILDQDSSQ